MNINYVFDISSEEEIDKLSNWKSISSNPNNWRLCVARERYLELEHFVKKGHALFFNKKTGQITDPDFNPVSTSGSVLVARTDIDTYTHMMMTPHPWCTDRASYEKIEGWYNFVPPNYIGRRFEVTTPREITSIGLDYFINRWKNENGDFFVKSIKKEFSYNGSPKGFREFGVAYSLETGADNKEIMFQECLVLKEDDEDTLEYRCFYLFGRLLSISRYHDYISLPVPQDVWDLARRYEKEIVSSILPETVVIDIFDTNRGLIFGEANALPCSGRYVDITLDSFPLVRE